MTRSILPSGYRPPSHPPVDNPRLSPPSIRLQELASPMRAPRSIPSGRSHWFVRASSNKLGILVSDLPEGTIVFNGATWRIKSYPPVPSPLGEADGEIMPDPVV